MFLTNFEKLFLSNSCLWTCRAGSKLEVQDVPAAVTPTSAMPPVTHHVLDETYFRRWRTNNWWGYEPLRSNLF